MYRTLLPLPAMLLLTAPALAQHTYDATIVEYTGLRYVCGDPHTPVLRIQNVGSATMLTCVVETWKNGLLIDSFNWELAVPAPSGATRQPVLPVVPGVQPGDVLAFQIISVNGEADQGPDGNLMEVPLDAEPEELDTYQVLVRVNTADIPTVLSWEITNAAAQIVAQGGPYTIPSATEEYWLTLSPNTCYMVRLRESALAGFSWASLTIESAEVEMIVLGGGGPITIGVMDAGFSTGLELGIPDVAGRETLILWPNPATDVVHLGIDNDRPALLVELFDASGRLVGQGSQGSAAGRAQLLVQHLVPGVYTVVLHDADGGVLRGRFVVQR